MKYIDWERELAYNVNEKELRKLALTVIEPKKLGLMSVYQVAQQVLKHYKLVTMGNKAVLIKNENYEKAMELINLLDVEE